MLVVLVLRKSTCNCTCYIYVQELSSVRKKKLKALDIEEDEQQQEARKTLREEQRAQLKELAGKLVVPHTCAGMCALLMETTLLLQLQ